MRLSRRTLSAGAIVVALLLGAAGCGSDVVDDDVEREVEEGVD